MNALLGEGLWEDLYGSPYTSEPNSHQQIHGDNGIPAGEGRFLNGNLK